MVSRTFWVRTNDPTQSLGQFYSTNGAINREGGPGGPTAWRQDLAAAHYEGSFSMRKFAEMMGLLLSSLPIENGLCKASQRQ